MYSDTKYTGSPPTEPHIVITNTREMIIPEELKVFGTQYDHGVETLTFDCPRYWDEHDLLKFAWYIQFRLADGSVGKSICKNVRVSETSSNIIHFDWTIKGDASLFGDKIDILACAALVDKDGTVLTDWNSKIGTGGRFDKGIHAGELAPFDTTKDLVSTFMAEINKIKELGTVGPEGPEGPPGDVNLPVFAIVDGRLKMYSVENMTDVTFVRDGASLVMQIALDE